MDDLFSPQKNAGKEILPNFIHNLQPQMAIHSGAYLLVDDDLDDQEIFSIAMRNVDPLRECVFANDGEQAIRLLKNKPIHPLIIFIDINMPRMNGLECLKEIKKLKQFARTPIYMISTAGNPAVIEECKQNGAIDYIIKSPSLAELEQKLSEIISASKVNANSGEWRKIS